MEEKETLHSPTRAEAGQSIFLKLFASIDLETDEYPLELECLCISPHGTLESMFSSSLGSQLAESGSPLSPSLGWDFGFRRSRWFYGNCPHLRVIDFIMDPGRDLRRLLRAERMRSTLASMLSSSRSAGSKLPATSALTTMATPSVPHKGYLIQRKLGRLEVQIRSLLIQLYGTDPSTASGSTILTKHSGSFSLINVSLDAEEPIEGGSTLHLDRRD